MSKTKAIENYRRGLSVFSNEIQDWLVDIYIEHGNHVDKRLIKLLKNNHPEYLLSNNDKAINGLQSISFRA